MTATLDQPVKAPTFQKLSLRRKVADNVATVLVTLSVAIAMVPLIWVLYTVISKGARLVLTSTWWTQSQRGITAREEGGGAYHAIVGTRTPPSQVLPLPPRSGFALPPSVPLISHGPLSLVKITSVFSSSPFARSASSTTPTPRSSARIIAA